jgi:membrane protease YdiL (CAAX protease family)
MGASSNGKSGSSMLSIFTNGCPNVFGELIFGRQIYKLKKLGCMQTYLKTKPVWMQLLLFMGMAFGLLMAIFLLGSALLSAVTGVGMLEMNDMDKLGSNPKRLTVLRSMMLLQFLGLFLIPSLLFAYFSDPKPAQYLGLKAPSKSGYWLVAVALLFAAIPAVEFTGIFNKSINFGKNMQTWAQAMEEDAQKTIQLLLASNTVSDLFINLVFIAGFAAVGEELFFRGILQRLFVRASKNPWVGIIIAAFLFSFLHFQFYGFIPRFLLGIVLGAIYWYSGSLWVAIAAHFVYDAFIIILVHLNPAMLQNPEAPMVNSAYLGIAALASAVVTGLLLWWMKKNTTANYADVYADDDPKATEKDFTF